MNGTIVRLGGGRPHWRALAPLLLTVVLALLLGLGAAPLLATLDDNDQITVGAVSGGLSTVVRAGDALVVVGGSSAPADLPALVDRSTLPWHRQVDLLVIPSWDTEQASGALGLIDRGQVRGVAVLGVPSSHPIWELLEATANRRGTPIRYLTGENTLDLAESTRLTLAGPPQAPGGPPAAVTLQYHEVRVILLTGPESANATPSSRRAHLIVSGTAVSRAASAEVLIRAKPERARDAASADVAYVGELAHGEHLTVRLSRSSLRIPLRRLQAVPRSTPPAR